MNTQASAQSTPEATIHAAKLLEKEKLAANEAHPPRGWEYKLTLLFAAIGDSHLPEAAHTSVQPEDTALFMKHNGIDASGSNDPSHQITH